MISYRITFRPVIPPGFSSRAWREILRNAMRAAAEHWHAEMLPGHFARNARAKYGYQPRSERYQGQKIKARGRGKAVDTVDLVYSGLARDSALKPPRIKAYPTRARLDLVVPPYINMRPNRGKGNTRPSLGEEMTRVTYAESRELAEVAMHFIGMQTWGVSASLQTAGRAKKVSSYSTKTNSSRQPDWMQSSVIICE